jgi:hypothetical protein
MTGGPGVLEVRGHMSSEFAGGLDDECSTHEEHPVPGLKLCSLWPKAIAIKLKKKREPK